MKCQSLFSEKTKKHIINLLFAEFAQRVVSFKSGEFRIISIKNLPLFYNSSLVYHGFKVTCYRPPPLVYSVFSVISEVTRRHMITIPTTTK